jgi:hypothetical protein
MDNVVLARIINTNWTAPCRTRFFCFGCASPMCSHCCERHGHRATHHPQEAGDPLLVGRLLFLGFLFLLGFLNRMMNRRFGSCRMNVLARFLEQLAVLPLESYEQLGSCRIK